MNNYKAETTICPFSKMGMQPVLLCSKVKILGEMRVVDVHSIGNIFFGDGPIGEHVKGQIVKAANERVQQMIDSWVVEIVHGLESVVKGGPTH